VSGRPCGLRGVRLGSSSRAGRLSRTTACGRSERSSGAARAPAPSPRRRTALECRERSSFDVEARRTQAIHELRTARSERSVGLPDRASGRPHCGEQGGRELRVFSPSSSSRPRVSLPLDVPEWVASSLGSALAVAPKRRSHLRQRVRKQTGESDCVDRVAGAGDSPRAQRARAWCKALCAYMLLRDWLHRSSTRGVTVVARKRERQASGPARRCRGPGRRRLADAPPRRPPPRSTSCSNGLGQALFRPQGPRRSSTRAGCRPAGPSSRGGDAAVRATRDLGSSARRRRGSLVDTRGAFTASLAALSMPCAALELTRSLSRRAPPSSPSTRPQRCARCTRSPRLGCSYRARSAPGEQPSSPPSCARPGSRASRSRASLECVARPSLASLLRTLS